MTRRSSTLKKVDKDKKLLEKFPILLCYRPQKKMALFKMKKKEIFDKYKHFYDKYLEYHSPEELVNELVDEMSSYFALSIILNNEAISNGRALLKVKKELDSLLQKGNKPKPNLRIVKE